MSIVAPPRPPIMAKSYGDRGPKKLFTINSDKNRLFTIRSDNTAVLGFKDRNDALFVSKMIETHIIHENEWPDILSDKLVLPSGIDYAELHHVYIQEWEPDAMFRMCVGNFLELFTVSEISDKNSSINFSGQLSSFTESDEYYRKRLAELYELGT
jgi:hypothetical protein